MKSKLAALALAVATSAFAAGPGAPKSIDKVQALDTDGDGLISLAEAQQSAPALAARFNELDTNSDGYLSAAETGEGRRSLALRGNAAETFAAADSNADGKLSRAEADQGMPPVGEQFTEIDTSKDGYVTLDEIERHAKSNGPMLIKKVRGSAAADR